MKHNLHQQLRVELSVDLSTVTSAELLFWQPGSPGPVTRTVLYPGGQAQRVPGENAILVSWTAEDSAPFTGGVPILVAPRVTVSGTTYDLETGMADFQFGSSLAAEVLS